MKTIITLCFEDDEKLQEFRKTEYSKNIILEHSQSSTVNLRDIVLSVHNDIFTLGKLSEMANNMIIAKLPVFEAPFAEKKKPCWKKDRYYE